MNISKNIQGYPVKCAGVRKNKRINPVCMMCDIFDIKKYYTKSTWRISGINPVSYTHLTLPTIA